MVDDGLLKTTDLQARIELELGLIIDPSTIRAWIARDEHPLPVAYKGKNGQSHKFQWADFLAWYLEEQERAPVTSSATEADIDQLDWHSARTISARERAKKDIIETRRLEGRYGDITVMEQTAEDRARQAVNRLMALPSRLAPRLALMADELEIDRLLDTEFRALCAEIERAATQAIGDESAPEEEPAA